jgi:hypothetical protein
VFCRINQVVGILANAVLNVPHALDHALHSGGDFSQAAFAYWHDEGLRVGAQADGGEADGHQESRAGSAALGTHGPYSSVCASQIA